MMSVTAENVDCFESGVICRKSLLISIGRSFIVFDDDSGRPVRILLIFHTNTYNTWISLKNDVLLYKQYGVLARVLCLLK